jgi:hypothetical protein
MYLFLIPLFAGLYLLLPPKSFHQPLLHLETQYVDRDARRVVADFQEAVDLGLRAEGDMSLVYRCGHHVYVTVQEVTVTGDHRARFTIKGSLRQTPDADFSYGFTTVVEANPFGHLERGRLRGTADWYRLVPVRRPDEDPRRALYCDDGRISADPKNGGAGYEPWLVELFPVYMIDEEVPGRGGAGRFFVSSPNHARMSAAAVGRLRSYINAVSGDPRSASGAPLRMLYLSVVTVTTLGFGDITPLSTTSRVVVGTEAVFGVVFAGLFLNAITTRDQRSREVRLGHATSALRYHWTELEVGGTPFWLPLTASGPSTSIGQPLAVAVTGGVLVASPGLCWGEHVALLRLPSTPSGPASRSSAEEIPDESKTRLRGRLSSRTRRS